MDAQPHFPGAHAGETPHADCCGQRCPECGKPCLNDTGHALHEAHYCDRNHRWGEPAEGEIEHKAR